MRIMRQNYGLPAYIHTGILTSRHINKNVLILGKCTKFNP